VIVILAVVVMIMPMSIIITGKTALTGRKRRHSTAGLTVVAAAILPGA
jgi:hypothetical protein